MKLQSLFEAF